MSYRNKYDDLSEVGKSLINLLYQNNHGNNQKHPLEDYIIAFDQNMDDDSAIRAIGERIGIDIPNGVIAHDYFYNYLANHIQQNY